MIKNFQLFIDRIVQRIDVERIYQFVFPRAVARGAQEGRKQLLLVVNPVKGMAPNAVAPIVSLCMSDLEEEIPFEMIITGEWSNKVKQGSMYHTYASLPDHLLYAASKKPHTLFSGKNITGLLELAQYHYDKARTVSDEFRAGVDNFLAKEDYTQATYMLHQFVETRLKAFKTNVLGAKCGKGHNLEQLFKTVRGSLPVLQDLFPYDELQRDLLRKLDQSYVKTLKWDQIDITTDEFEVLRVKCELAKEEMDSYVVLMLTCIEDYRNSKEAEEEKAIQEQAIRAEATEKESKAAELQAATKTIVCEDFSGYPWLPRYTEDVNKLLDKIRSSHNPEQITMLNYQTGGFTGVSLFQQGDQESDGAKVELYLVVIMKNTGPFHFKCMQVGVASAMVVYLSVAHIERKLAEGDRFVHTLWTKGRVLRRKSTFEPKFEIAGIDWKRELEEVEKIIERPKYMCADIGSNLQSVIVEDEINYCILRTLLEAVVISYLRCAIGFVPKDVPLRDLIDWTGVCSRELIEFLQTKDDVGARQLYLFLRPERMWKNGYFDELYGSDFLKDVEIQSHLKFYQALLNDVLEKQRLMVKPEVEALGKI